MAADEFDDDIYSGLQSVTAAVNVYGGGGAPAKKQVAGAAPDRASDAAAGTAAPAQPQPPQGGAQRDPAASSNAAGATKRGVCYAWQSGTCLRGNSCWYAHIGESGAGRPDRGSEKKQEVHPGKMFVGGIPWEATEQDLVACFTPFGELLSASIVKDKMTGRSRGFGFVTYTLPASLDAVFAPDKVKTHEIRGRVVDVRRAVPWGQEGSTGERKTFRDAPQNNAAGNNPWKRNGAGSGGAQAGNSEDWKRKVFVGGIPNEVDKDAMFQYFAQFGTVVDARLMFDRVTGRSRGFGFVTFEKPETVDSVLVQRHIIGDRAVELKRAVPKGEQQRMSVGMGPRGEYARDPRGGMASGGAMQDRATGSGSGGYGDARAHQGGTQRGDRNSSASSYGSAYGSAYGSVYSGARGDRSGDRNRWATDVPSNDYHRGGHVAGRDGYRNNHFDRGGGGGFRGGNRGSDRGGGYIMERNGHPGRGRSGRDHGGDRSARYGRVYGGARTSNSRSRRSRSRSRSR